MSLSELAAIQGVDEGLEHRLKKTAHKATSFSNWMEAIKTKRYTWTRLQRMFVHLLTNTKKTDIAASLKNDSVPYVRLLALTKKRIHMTTLEPNVCHLLNKNKKKSNGSSLKK